MNENSFKKITQGALMGITVKQGPEWKRAVEILIAEAETYEDIADDKFLAERALRIRGLEDQANEISAMSPDEWNDFATNHIY